MGEAALRGALLESHVAFLEWRRTGFSHRASLMKKVAADLRAGKESFAALMADEMGKPVRDGKAEVEKCAVCCDFYAERAEGFLDPEHVSTEAKSRNP